MSRREVVAFIGSSGAAQSAALEWAGAVCDSLLDPADNVCAAAYPAALAFLPPAESEQILMPASLRNGQFLEESLYFYLSV